MQTDLSTMPTEWIVLFILLAAWEITWKGLALWRASKRHEKAWFVIILLINTVGILPIIYLLVTNKGQKSA